MTLKDICFDFNRCLVYTIFLTVDLFWNQQKIPRIGHKHNTVSEWFINILRVQPLMVTEENRTSDRLRGKQTSLIFEELKVKTRFFTVELLKAVEIICKPPNILMFEGWSVNCVIISKYVYSWFANVPRQSVYKRQKEMWEPFQSIALIA